MSSSCSCSGPVAEFGVAVVWQRRAAGLRLAMVDSVSYWVTEMPDIEGALRRRVTAQWIAGGVDHRAQLGDEWVHQDEERSERLATALVRSWHRRIVAGDVPGRVRG